MRCFLYPRAKTANGLEPSLPVHTGQTNWVPGSEQHQDSAALVTDDHSRPKPAEHVHFSPGPEEVQTATGSQQGQEEEEETQEEEEETKGAE